MSQCNDSMAGRFSESKPISDLPPEDFINPVIEAYKKDVDRTLIRESLKLTQIGRLQKLESYVASAIQLRGLAKRREMQTGQS